MEGNDWKDGKDRKMVNVVMYRTYKAKVEMTGNAYGLDGKDTIDTYEGKYEKMEREGKLRIVRKIRKIRRMCLLLSCSWRVGNLC